MTNMIVYKTDQVELINNKINELKKKSMDVNTNITDIDKLANSDIISLNISDVGGPIIDIPFLDNGHIEIMRYTPMSGITYEKDAEFIRIVDHLRVHKCVDIDSLLYLLHTDIIYIDKALRTYSMSQNKIQLLEHLKKFTLLVYTNMIYKTRLDVIMDMYLSDILSYDDYNSHELMDSLNLVRVIRKTDIVDISMLDTLAATSGCVNTSDIPFDMYSSSFAGANPALEIYNKNYQIKN